MSSPGGHVCWEWQRDDGGYCPYTPEVSQAIEAAYASGKHQYQVFPYTLDFTSSQQHKHGGRTRGIQRVTVDLGPGSDIAAYWMWCEYPGQYVCYQVEASVDIERAYQSQSTIVNLSKCPCLLPYTINFKNMNQTRHHYNTKREIKRVPLSAGHTLQNLLKNGHLSSAGMSGATGMYGAAAATSVSSGLLGGSSMSGYGVGGSGLGVGGTGYGVSGSGHGVGGSAYGVPGSTALSHSSHYHLPGGVSSSSMAAGTSAFSLGNSSGKFGAAGHAPSSAHTHHTHYPSAHAHHTHSSAHAHHTFATPAPSPYPTGYSSAYSKKSTPASHTSTGLGIGSSLNSTTGTHFSAASATSRSSPAATRSKSKSAGTARASKGVGPATAMSRKSGGISSAKSGAISSAVSKGSKGKSKAKGTKKKVSSSVEYGAAGGVASGGDAGDSGDIVAAHARKVNRLKPKHDEPCPICMNNLSEASGFEDDDALPTSGDPVTPNVYRLRKCGHKLHLPCLNMYIKNSSKGGFQCPTCKKSYGAQTGDMPDGSMSVQTYGSPLPGHPGEGTIQITYNFTPGVHNGKRYRTNGFPRVCYLPNSAKGQKVLRLLRVAWQRRLTFTIGTSVTTGSTDTVVWNEIHHKTEAHSNHSGHGYPDPGYLDRVLLELAAQGVEDKQEEDDEEEVESSDSSSEEEEPDVTVTESGGTKLNTGKAAITYIDGDSDESL